MDRELPRRRGAGVMNAGAWRLPGFNNDACALIMSFLCLAAPQNKNTYPAISCGVSIQRNIVCIREINYGGPGFSHKNSTSIHLYQKTTVNTASSYTPSSLKTQQLNHDGIPTPLLSRIRNRLLHGLSNLRPQPHPRLRRRHRRQIRPNALLPCQRKKGR